MLTCVNETLDWAATPSTTPGLASEPACAEKVLVSPAAIDPRSENVADPRPAPLASVHVISPRRARTEKGDVFDTVSETNWSEGWGPAFLVDFTSLVWR